MPHGNNTKTSSLNMNPLQMALDAAPMFSHYQEVIETCLGHAHITSGDADVLGVAPNVIWKWYNVWRG